MGQTYYYSDVVNMISPNISRNVEASTAAHVCNIVTNEIWKRFDWRESLATLPPFYLVPREQDYGAPAVSVPTDFMGLRQAFYTNLNSSPVYYFPLTYARDLGTTSVEGFPTSISYQRDKAAFRVFPLVPANFGAPYYMITGTYKKEPTKVTAANYTNTYLPFEDIYLEVWLEGLKWAFWNLQGDQRAMDQYGLFRIAIEQMASNEGLELADPILAPREGLVGYTSGYPWIL